MKLDVENVMSRVRAEIVRRSGASANGNNLSPIGSGPIALGDAPLPQKPEYVLSDLLAYSDVAFIENAYAAVLCRRPDPDGMRIHLDELRSGKLSKVEVLAALRWSAEGVARGVHVDGLLVPYLLRKWSRKPVIGSLIGWFHAVIRLPRVARQAEMLEATQSRHMASLAAQANNALELHAAGHAQLAERIEAQAERMCELRMEFEDVTTSAQNALLAQMEGLRLELEEKAVSAQNTLLEQAQTLEELKHLPQVLIEQQQRLDGLQRALDAQHHQVVAHDAALAGEARRKQEEEGAERSLAPMYVAFEQRFRGSAQLVRERMTPYLAHLREAQVGGLETPLLDIGCGNGEWLELLRDHGFSARGIDTNPTFVDLCRGRGLEVTVADALDVLRALPTGSLGAVTGMHIAEHLPFQKLVALLDEARRALCMGGLLILETPNPENLLVASHYFYMDPTHRNPIPPQALRWIVESRGYLMCRIERLTVARELEEAPPYVADDIPGASSINALLSHLHAAPDYAIIARRL